MKITNPQFLSLKKADLMRILSFWFFETRFLIALHYLFLTAFGIFLGNQIFGKPINIARITLICLSIFFAYQTSIIFNDINDLKTDLLAKKKTPLFTKEISINQYQIWGIVFFFISILFALIISYQTMLIILIIHVLHFLYSSPPFRLKRFYPISISMLVLGALFAAVAGFSLYESSKPFLSFPFKASLFIVIPLFWGLNFRDLADYQGDHKTGIASLFTLLGLKKGRIANGIFMLISYITVPVILQYPLLFIATIPLGIFSLYFCLKRPFQEKYAFYVYFVLIVILMVAFTLEPKIIID